MLKLSIHIHGTHLAVDSSLLLQQTAALGRILGPPPHIPTPREVTLLTGIWNMLHDMLDRADGAPARHRAAQRTKNDTPPT